jgi:RsiW-degrading membrane proteinase PrsW (M82 family)
MNQHYKPKPRPLWDLLTALLLGIWFAIFAAAYFDILTK